MNEEPDIPPVIFTAPQDLPPPITPPPFESGPFFQRADWLAFALTTALVLAGYLWTLAPDVTTDMSGAYATGAMYAGGMPPSGYPLWVIYAWLFTKLLPFSNIAWRVAVSTAFAGALTCGLIALMAARAGALILDGFRPGRRLDPRDESRLRITCGCIAGLAFGFDNAFWNLAVVVEVWPFSLLLLTLVFVLLMRWFYAPARRRYLYAAAFMYGLTLTNSEALLTAAFGLQLFVLLGDRELGRDLFFANVLLLLALLGADKWGFIYLGYSPLANLRDWYVAIALASGLLSFAMILRTRKFLTRWLPVCVTGLMLFLGMLMYFYLPISSMTTPPVNWGYARTLEGFVHVLYRGQYEQAYPTSEFGRYFDQLGFYFQIASDEFGLLYLIAALIPFCLLHRMRSLERRWLLGTLAIYLCLSLLLVDLLNPLTDYQGGRDLFKIFFTASHIILALWAGLGLILLGTWLNRPAAGSREEEEPAGITGS
jgi:hypothetical protein